MQGTLFKYGPLSTHLAFAAAPPPAAPPAAAPCRKHLVLLGGLTDGLLSLPYAATLAAAVHKAGWQLVQAQLSSSYQGWGLASLDQDADELAVLARHLHEQRGSEAWVLLGHSTGCQDAVRYASRYRTGDPRLSGIILQAPVSDREFLEHMMSSAWRELLPQAQAMVDEGRGDDLLFRAVDLDGAAVTARRLMALMSRLGDDDMFSCDLSLAELQGVLGHLRGLPCLILQSGADGAVPEHLHDSGAVRELGQRMLQAIRAGPPPRQGAAAAAHGSGGSSAPLQLRVLEGAGHALAGHEEELASVVREFLAALPCSAGGGSDA